MRGRTNEHSPRLAEARDTKSTPLGKSCPGLVGEVPRSARTEDPMDLSASEQIFRAGDAYQTQYFSNDTNNG
ncbi:hypothetical protein HDF08_000572 [Edaphobacter lichenicola]|uniref:Uncharacterized protein n=1 Tax=Tunturiibacter lichenicola TaxID=2051959 RepID=A0A852VE23_9BACT|nr:hypothetical protein [Edaphobacter lichenicola]